MAVLNILLGGTDWKAKAAERGMWEDENPPR